MPHSIILFILIDYCLKLLESEEASAQYFEISLSNLNHEDSNYKTFTLSYAFWLYYTSTEPLPSYTSYKYFKLLDTVLIVYGPDPNIVKVIDESRFLMDVSSITNFSFSDSFDEINYAYVAPILFRELAYISDPSVGIFKKYMNSPIVIKDLISHWSALKKWDKPSFWVELAGHRFFPVEIGCHYQDIYWTQEIIQLNDFFQKYVFNINNDQIAYIAQHNWIHQIPLLARDFEILDLCEIFLDPCMDNVITHMWFGVKGTFTPLHYDKYNNILTQIVGQKYILLVDPVYSNIFTDGFNNSSKIVDENISDHLQKLGIPFNEVILKPGDSLFIPSNWWHQVKSLNFSISISFWF